MAKFGYLDVPDQWNQYFTKYPQGYTILEALLNWVQQVGDMVDNVNDWNTYLDDFKAQFDDELQDTLEEVLTDWNQTGLLGQIINTVIQNQLDTIEVELTTKATKDELNALGQLKLAGVYDTLASLQSAYPTGTTGLFLVTADGFTYRWNASAWTKTVQFQATGIADNSITPEKLSAPYLKTYKNLGYQNGGYLTPAYTGTGATYIGSMGNYNTLAPGNYLVFVDFSLTGTDLVNATFNPMLFDGTNIRIPSVAAQSPSYAVAPDKTRMTAYGIVNVPAQANFRTGIYVSSMNTGRTNILNMTVNKLYVVAMDTVNTDVVNAMSYYTGVSANVPVLTTPDTASNKTDIANLKLSISPSSPILAFGDSMTGSTAGWVNTLATNNGVSILNRGIGGQTAAQIATRQGGLSWIVQPFTIPADTSKVPITLNQALYAQQSTYEGINPVYINGIKGTIENTTNTAGGFTFARSAAGTQTVVSRPTAVLTDNMQTYRKNPMIIWLGTNGDYTAGVRSADNLIEIIDYMLSYGECKKFMVIGLTTDTSLGIPDINTALAKKYGRRFLDLRSYLIQYGLSDMAITPTSADTARIQANNVPTSLMSDDTHLTTACQQQVVAPLVLKKLQELYMI